jgi:hypothetical protein
MLPQPPSTETSRYQELPLSQAPSAHSIPTAVGMVFGTTKCADLITDDGRLVTLRLTGLQGARLTATAPRLTVRQGSTLAGHFIDSEHLSWTVSMVCLESIEVDRRMRLILDVSAISDDNLRAVGRLDIVATITLRSKKCADLREGEEIRGQVVNLSRAGLEFTCQAALVPGDRLGFHVRFMEGPIDGELGVTSVSGGAGATTVGCWFSAIEPASLLVIDKALDRGQVEHVSVSYPQMRALFHEPQRSRHNHRVFGAGS